MTEVGLASELVELLWFRPGFAAVLGAEQQVLLQHLAAFLLVCQRIALGEDDDYKPDLKWSAWSLPALMGRFLMGSSLLSTRTSALAATPCRWYHL